MGDKKSGVDPLSAVPAADGIARRPRRNIANRGTFRKGAVGRRAAYVRLLPTFEKKFLIWSAKKTCVMSKARAMTAMMSAYSTMP